MRMTARRWNCTPRPASRRCASQALATAALGTHDHSGRHTRHCSRLKQPCACNHGGRHARPLRPGQTTLLACRILASASVLTANARSERASSVQRKPRRHALVRIHDTAATPSEGLSCTDPTAVGTHDHSDRHARHCSWLNRCIPAVASARGHRQCQHPDASHAPRLPFARTSHVQSWLQRFRSPRNTNSATRPPAARAAGRVSSC